MAPSRRCEKWSGDVAVHTSTSIEVVDTDLGERGAHPGRDVERGPPVDGAPDDLGPDARGEPVEQLRPELVLRRVDARPESGA